MINLDPSNIEWDGAQHCAVCDKTFFLKGKSEHAFCPDCGGPLFRIDPSEAANNTEALDETTTEILSGIGQKIFSQISPGLNDEPKFKNSAPVKQCLNCKHIFTDKKIKELKLTDTCPTCQGTLAKTTIQSAVDGLLSPKLKVQSQPPEVKKSTKHKHWLTWILLIAGLAFAIWILYHELS